jgi:hypothetical protein
MWGQFCTLAPLPLSLAVRLGKLFVSRLVFFANTPPKHDISVYNYTLYKNPGFWLVDSRCIFRVFSYLGLISFIFTAAGVFASWGFNFLPSRASIRQIHSEYFFFTFICKVTWLMKFETRKCSKVKDLTFFPSAVPLRKRISLVYPHVPQTTKFIQNTSTTV